MSPVSHELVDRLLAEAAVSDDFGNDAREGIRVLLNAVEADADLGDDVFDATTDRVRTNLSKVATLEQDRRERGEIPSQEIQRPLFILGLPRTGTSILQALLGAVHGARTLMQWEVACFSPPPGPTPADDPRIVALDEAMSAPELDAIRIMHPIGALQPSECGPLLESSFRSTHFCMDLRVRSYFEWYLDADNTPAYELHRRWLQHFQSTDPSKRWVCKIQEHMYHVPELLSVYPDAILVQPHRDPATVIASISSLIATLRQNTFGAVDPIALGQEMIQLWGSGLQKFMAFRRANPDVTVYDLDYRDIVRDPAGTVAAIHRYFDLPWTGDDAAAVAAWWEANPKDKAGRHHYSLDDWGLTRGDVYDAYADYRATFAPYL